MQIEHANYEYSTWTDDPKPKSWIWTNLVPTLKFARIIIRFSIHNKANMLRINIALSSLEHSRGYSLRMIVGCQIRFTIRTWIISLTNTTLKVIKSWD